MNKIVNKFFLAGDKFMPEIHLRPPGFRKITKLQRLQKCKETGDSRYIYQIKLDKVSFQHDKAYGTFKDLTRRTASDKLLYDKTFNIAKNLKFDEYQRGLASMVHRIFDKTTFAVRANKFAGGVVKNENMSNRELAEKLHKPIIRKFKKRKVY